MTLWLTGDMKSLSCDMIQFLKIPLGNLENILVEGCGKAQSRHLKNSEWGKPPTKQPCSQ